MNKINNNFEFFRPRAGSGLLTSHLSNFGIRFNVHMVNHDGVAPGDLVEKTKTNCNFCVPINEKRRDLNLAFGQLEVRNTKFQNSNFGTLQPLVRFGDRPACLRFVRRQAGHP